MPQTYSRQQKCSHAGLGGSLLGPFIKALKACSTDCVTWTLRKELSCMGKQWLHRSPTTPTPAFLPALHILFCIALLTFFDIKNALPLPNL